MLRLGIADHLGWAVAVTASAGEVVDRRRIELVEAGVTPASIARTAAAAPDDLANSLPAPIVSMSLRVWPLDFPTDVAVQRRAPYEARADANRYRRELAELAHARGWEVHVYDAKAVVAQAGAEISELGPPWTKDHRVALAATIMAGV